MPKGPELTPDYSNQTSGGGGSSGSGYGGLVGLVLNMGKKPRREERMDRVTEARDREERVERDRNNGDMIVAGNRGATKARYPDDYFEIGTNKSTTKPTPNPVPVITPTPISESPKPQEPSATEVTAGSAVAGTGIYTYGTDVWQKIKDSAEYIGTVIAENPVAAAIIIGGVVIAGGAAFMYKKSSSFKAQHDEFVSHTSGSHTEVHTTQPQQPETPKPVLLKGHRDIERPKDSEVRHKIQLGDPRLRGEKAHIVIKKGQELPHGFKDNWGHFAEYNDKTKAKIIECYEQGTHHGRNAHGKEIITMTDPQTGQQLWVHYVPGEGIVNSGSNPQHLPICPDQGLPYKPIGVKIPKEKGHGTRIKTLIGAGAGASSLNMNASQRTREKYGIKKIYGKDEYNQYVLPEPPSDIPVPPKDRKLHIGKRDRRIIDEIVKDYSKTLDPNLPAHEQARLQYEAREKLINNL
jgi:hypothetical protein